MIMHADAMFLVILIGKNSGRIGERRWHLGACALAGTMGCMLSGFSPATR